MRGALPKQPVRIPLRRQQGVSHDLAKVQDVTAEAIRKIQVRKIGTPSLEAGAVTPAKVVSTHALVGVGTAFPAAPATDDLFFRTDRGVLYYYDGTRWLSVEEYALVPGGWTYVASNVLVATNVSVFLASVPDAGGGTQVLVTKMVNNVFIGATNDAVNRWSIEIGNVGLAEVFAALDTGTPDLPGSWNRVVTPIDSVRTVATDKHWNCGATKLNAPTNINLVAPTIHYRLIG